MVVTGAAAIVAAIIGSVFSIVFIVGGLWLHAYNTEATLRNAFNAQQKSNESSFDKTWKIISQEAGVAEQERDTFKSAYTSIMTASKGVAGNGQLASFFTQAKIDVSPQLFEKLMTSIESQRESFHRDQQHLLKIKQQHDDILTTMPSSLFLSGKQPLEAKLVTSAKTSQAFESGQDNDTKLFEQKAGG